MYGMYVVNSKQAVYPVSWAPAEDEHWPLRDPGWPSHQHGDVGRCPECWNSGKGLRSNNTLFWEGFNMCFYYHGQECVRAKSTVDLETVMHKKMYLRSLVIQLSFIWVISVTAHHRKTFCNGKQKTNVSLWKNSNWPVCFCLVPSEYDPVVMCLKRHSKKAKEWLSVTFPNSNYTPRQS